MHPSFAVTWAFHVALATVEPHAPNPAFEALPFASKELPGGGRLEAGLLVKDLRQLADFALHRRASVARTRLGRRAQGGDIQYSLLGFDPTREIERLVMIAAPAGGKVPIGLLIYSSPRGIGLRALIKTEAGFVHRLRDRLASEEGLRWPVEISGKRVRIKVLNWMFSGTVEKDEWLVLDTDELPTYEAGETTALFAPRMQQITDESDALLFVRGQGTLLSTILQIIGGTPAELLSEVRAAALGWEIGTEGALTTRIVLDVPALSRMRLYQDRPALSNPLASLWGEKATAYLSVALPPALITDALPFIERELGSIGAGVPDGVLHALTRLEGRIGIVSFGSPADWALALTFEDEQTPVEVTPALYQWLLSIFQQEQIAADRTFTLESIGGRPLIHIRPDDGIEGWRITSIGRALVAVRQKARLLSLAEHDHLPIDESSGLSLAPEPLTSPVRKVLQSRSLLLGYMILGTDGSLFEYGSWLTSGFSQLALARSQNFGDLAPLAKMLVNLPSLVMLDGVSWSLMYDVALSADVRDNILVLQMVNSEI